MKVITVEFMV